MATGPRGKRPGFGMSKTSFEIERKFMVDKLPESIDKFPSKEILQGYLAITRDGTEVRIRKRGSKCSVDCQAWIGQDPSRGRDRDW